MVNQSPVASQQFPDHIPPNSCQTMVITLGKAPPKHHKLTSYSFDSVSNDAYTKSDYVMRGMMVSGLFSPLK